MIKHRLLVALATSIIVAMQQASASGGDIADFYASYKRGDYSQAVSIGENLLGKDQKDLKLRYYLADSYVKLGKREAALGHYRYCASQNKSVIGNFAAEAIRRLQADDPEITDRAEFEKRLGEKTRSARERLLEQAEVEKKRAAENFDRKMKAITANKGLSPDEQERRMKQAYSELDRQEEEITGRYQKQADALLARQDRLLKQTAGTGSTRVVPKSSSMNVQSFENLGDESDASEIPLERPLDARPLELKKNSLKKNSPQRKMPR